MRLKFLLGKVSPKHCFGMGKEAGNGIIVIEYGYLMERINDLKHDIENIDLQ